jgi:hypothetical protein
MQTAPPPGLVAKPAAWGGLSRQPHVTGANDPRRSKRTPHESSGSSMPYAGAGPAPVAAVTGGDMQMTGSHGIWTRAGRTLLAGVALVALAAVLAAGLSACGGDSGVAGTYKYGSGTEKQMAEFKLTLNDDKTYKLAGPDPLGGGGDVSITGTYVLDGDKIALKDEEGVESDTGTVDGDKLVFPTVTWVKE